MGEELVAESGEQTGGQSFAIVAKVSLTTAVVAVAVAPELSARIDGDNVWELLPFCADCAGRGVVGQ